MVQLLKQTDAKLLNLPGRSSREAVSGALGSRMSFRIVEIAPRSCRRGIEDAADANIAEGDVEALVYDDLRPACIVKVGPETLAERE